MSFRKYFPAMSWTERAITGRIARRMYLAVLLFLLLLGTAYRVCSYVLTRRMEAVITGLGKLEIDKSGKEDVVRLVPRLVRWEPEDPVKRTPETGDVDLGTEIRYYVTISNETSWFRYYEYIRFFRFCSSDAKITKDDGEAGCEYPLADLLGFRYMAFGASVILLNGKVTAISYGVADRFTGPRVFGEILSVRSAHSFWVGHRASFEIKSTDDESPQYRVEGSEHGLKVLYTYDAPRELMAHAFHADLSCFWGLLGCRHVKQIAPQLWLDRNRIEASTLARLQSEKPCPDRILAGRMRYLPDTVVVILKSKEFGPQSVTLGNQSVQRIATLYEPVETVKGGVVPKGIWSVWAEDTVPFPGDYRRRLPNRGLRWAIPGERVLAFSNMRFDSCVILPATPSALAAVRSVEAAPRRREDQLIFGLM